MTEHANSLRQLFHRATRIADREEQARFLDEVCADDEQRLQLERMLAVVSDEITNPLDRMSSKLQLRPPDKADLLNEEIHSFAAASGRVLGSSDEKSQIGTQVGPYRLLEQIGEGGMGAVYVAEQTEPVRRRVAVKIIKPGMDSKQVVARFEAERQALAMMDHPNIAKVLDGGRTEQGRPYFVMELVKGSPITEFCDQHKLDMRQRLELFITVCHAVQHAHMKGIIHRDLKPSNVIVAFHDVQPVVKVIDFGIAKATNQQLTDLTVFTQCSQLMGTPMYMSPEQADQSAQNVDTRTDIYSLGVLLYELLTGTTPFDEYDLKNKNLFELRHVICEQEPLRPSARLSTLRNGLAPVVSTNRELEPRKLSLLMKRELDWVVMKTLEKDRGRRYETASALAADIQRYLDDEPVEACPPSLSYRTRKFASRHKAVAAAVAVAAAFLLVIVAGLVFHSNRLNTANDTLEALNAELVASHAATRELLYVTDMRLAFQAWDRRQLNELADLLHRHKPREGAADIRGTEWHLLSALAKHPEPVVFLGHEGPVREIALVPGREEFVSVGDDGTIRHWSIRERRLLRTIESQSDQLHAVAVSSDGRWFATGSSILQLWDFTTGEKVRDLTSADFTLESVAFTPDGKSLAAGWRYDEVRVISLDGKVRAHLPPTGCRNETLVFSRDGSKLFVPFKSSTGHVIRKWEVDAPNEWTDLGQGSKLWNRAAVTFDDAVSAALAHSGGQVHFIENVTGRIIGMLGAGSETIRAVGFSPRGDRIVWGTDDGMMNCASLPYGWQAGGTYALPPTPARTISAHDRKITDVEYLSEDRVLTSSEDGSIKLWRLSQAQVSVQMDARGPAQSVAFSPNGEHIVIPCDNGRLWVADAAEGREVAVVEIGEQDLTNVAFCPDESRILVADDRGRIVAWDCAEGQIRAEWVHPGSSTIRDIAVSPHGDVMASVAGDQLLRIHDAESLSVVDTIEMSENVMAADYAPDGRCFA